MMRPLTPCACFLSAALVVAGCHRSSNRLPATASTAAAGVSSARPGVSSAAPASGSSASPATSGGAAPVLSGGGGAPGGTPPAGPLAPRFAGAARHAARLASGEPADVYHPNPPDLGRNPSYAFAGVVFLPGAQIGKDHYSELATLIARHGFVVVVPEHRHALLPGLYPHVGLVERTLEWLRAEDQRAGSPLQGAIDASRLAALGHSFGGLAALRALSDDNGPPTGWWGGFRRPAELRCAVAFATKTALVGRPAPVPNAGLPVCLIQGEPDQKTRLDEAWETFLQVQEAPAALVTVRGAGHFLAANVDDPPGAVADPATPTLPQADAVATAGRWASWFLRAHLDGDSAAWDAIYVAGAQPDPGVEVAAVAPAPRGLTLTQHVVARGSEADGAAYAVAADLDGDGIRELIVSSFGPLRFPIPGGEVSVYRLGSHLGDWRREVALPSRAGVQFPNQVTPYDVDGDGDLDLIVPAGFLATEAIPLVGRPSGRLLWLEAAPGGWVRRDVTGVTPRFYHGAVPVDVDRDGVLDLLTVGERKPLFGREEAEAVWFRGDAALPARFEGAPRAIGPGLGSFPVVRDLDGDGDLDVASAEFFVPGSSYAWYERLADPSPAAPAGTWVRHAIAQGHGPAIQLSFVPDLQGDGVLRALGSNHVQARDPEAAAVRVFDIPADPRAPWPSRVISRGIRARPGSAFSVSAAPGLVATGDVDGDGDLDVVVCGDGDPRVLWLEQVRPGDFVTHVLARKLGQAGGLELADLDGDGRSEVVVTGYEDDQVLIFSR